MGPVKSHLHGCNITPDESILLLENLKIINFGSTFY